MMKVQKFGITLIAAALVVTLSGCSLFAPKITDDNTDTRSDSTSTQTTTNEKKEETKTVDYTAQLVGTYELDHEDLTDASGTQHVTHDDYQQLVDATGLHFTLELSDNGYGTMTAPDFQNNKTSSLSFKWKTDDGKSIIISGSSEDDKIEGKVNEDGQITLEITDDGETMTMVFNKVSDKPGYYSNSSKN